MGKVDLIKLIDDAIIKKASSKESRNYMGASCLGEPCDARLWYSYKFPKPILDPRINRIFDLGHNLEDVLVRYLIDAGITLYTVDENGEQFGFTDGIIAGHIDGVIELEDPCLIEFKTYNTKRFEQLKKIGVKESDPKYYVQCCVYMDKMDLKKCIFMAIDKNDCEIYIEEILDDPFEANYAINRGKELGKRTDRPDRKYGHKSSFQCKMCDYRKECWSDD